MKLPVIYVLTHDSFYVGEDGPRISRWNTPQCSAPARHDRHPAVRPTETGAAWVAALKKPEGPPPSC